jgi:hypothetical protein
LTNFLCRLGGRLTFFFLARDSGMALAPWSAAL